MLRLMLNRHDNLAVPYETGFMTAFYPDTSFYRTPFFNRIAKHQDLSTDEAVARLLDDVADFPLAHEAEEPLIENKVEVLEYRPSSFPEMIDAVMTEYAIRHGKTRWGDKTPEYTEDIDIIWRLFPGCKIVHLVRDGRDVVLKQLNVKAKNWFAKSLPLLADRWAKKVTICHKVGSVLGPDYFLQLRYEDLVLNTEDTLRKICDFLNEPFDPLMLEYYKSSKDKVPGRYSREHSNTYRPPDPSLLGAWKREMSSADRRIFEEMAGQALDLFGYEREHLASSVSSKVKNLYYNILQRY